MLRALAVLSLSLAACGFQSGQPGVDAAEPLDEAGEPPPGTPLDVAHITPAEQAAFTPTADLSVGNLTIDTSAPSASPSLPSGTQLRVVAQAVAGPPLVFLEARDVTISSLIVVGSRPLVIHAMGAISIGSIIVAARATTPGAGGAAPDLGAGGGAEGDANGTADGGGGGAGFATAGSRGGTSDQATTTGGPGGVSVGDATLTTLVGGSGGGHGSPTNCSEISGGAGGGAIQLSAETTIAITGTIDAGGGGGRAGSTCGGNYSAGGGGGAGGAIYLQSNGGVLGGMLAANGGGGGGGANAQTGVGQPGEDGRASSAVAVGGTPAMDSGTGGDGGAALIGSKNGGTGHNGGGGGGSVGRIFVKVPATAPVTASSSPPLQRGP